jgi:hypothetical protein
MFFSDDHQKSNVKQTLGLLMFTEQPPLICWSIALNNATCIFPGIYPSPKACASMVVHKNNLILFGGWSQPTPFPLHQVFQVLLLII